MHVAQESHVLTGLQRRALERFVDHMQKNEEVFHLTIGNGDWEVAKSAEMKLVHRILMYDIKKI